MTDFPMISLIFLRKYNIIEKINTDTLFMDGTFSF